MNFGLSDEIYEKIKEIANKNSKYQFKIFGSRAKNTYKETSDIDIAVFKNVLTDDKYKIMNEFDLLDIIYKIDIVFVNEKTKKELLEAIEKEGVNIN